MIDLSKITYRVVVMDGNGNQYNITDYVRNLGWEEGENELSLRSSFTARNDETSKGYLSGLIRPGCLVGIFASDGGSLDGEAARGTVETWEAVEKNGANELRCTCYDGLYKLQASQENRFYPSGTGTKSAVQAIFNDWEMPQGEYKGPDVAHGKMAYNNRFLSDIIREILDDAAKKGGEPCIVREEKGYIQVLPKGGNETVYVFKEDNTQSFNQSISTADLITRVKVVGQADGDGRRSVEATVEGRTEYGIRQRIYSRGSDETVEAAKSAAQEILNNEGKIRRDMSVQSPDVPFIRKGDLAYIMSGSISGYYYVKSIRHNADACSMSMDLEYAEPEPEPEAEEEPGEDGQEKKEYQVGDTVNFHGGTHYISSYPGAKGYSARAGQARITEKDGSGGAHPWHLIHTDSASNVYGWVDDGTFD